MNLIESFDILSLSVLNTFLIDMNYDISKHSSYESRKGNIGVPLGYGTEFGEFYFGSSLIADSKHRGLPLNPIAGFGFGLGNSEKFIGLDSNISIGSTNPFGGEGMAHDSHYGFKLHKQFFLNNSISIGIENFISNGRDKNSYGSYFLNSTQLIPIFSSLLLVTIGAGTGRFYTSKFYKQNSDKQPNANITPIGIFGSLIYSFKPNFGVQVSSSSDIIGTILFFNPLFFTDLNGFKGGIGIMDLSHEINENNLNVTLSYLVRL
ncbi:hypothetical protein GCL60_13800 [Silvanigrella paludirubra]|uniref:Uncharacterized protein n=1 Tax=Silvanigrella paludirubra TaxID=2499159 RepID=A0A6N6VNZ5_9BACT|nr:hypothetical protein [Silvanigrella paludirubra]KAB8036913.1 hypothetical protein GCL60_13800 [Silvanigrella paludirubra]